MVSCSPNVISIQWSSSLTWLHSVILFTVLNRNADSEEEHLSLQNCKFLAIANFHKLYLCTLSTSCCKPKKGSKALKQEEVENSWLPNSGFAVKRKLVFGSFVFQSLWVWPDSAHQQRPWLPPKLRHPANGPHPPALLHAEGLAKESDPLPELLFPFTCRCVWSSAGGRGGHHGADLQANAH